MWEYKVVTEWAASAREVLGEPLFAPAKADPHWPIERWLNALGTQGWELFAKDEGTHGVWYFRREIGDDPELQKFLPE